jgi:integrase
VAIEKRPRKKGAVYVVRVKDRTGKWFPPKTFERKVNAQVYHRELEELKDKGSQAKSRRLREMSVLKYWQVWSKERRAETSPGWKLSQDQMVRDYVLPVIGKRKLGEIRPYDVGQLLRGVTEMGRSKQTVLHIYNLLHKMFADAVEEYEFLDFNPVKAKYRPKLRKALREFLKPDEARRLMQVCSDHWLGPAIWIGLLSGLRPSEIQALTWDSVNFESGHITIKAAYIRKTKTLQPYPKQGEWGRAPMPQLLMEYLLPKRRQISSQFVACGPTGEMLSYHSFYSGLKRLCKEAGVTPVTPHELRHSCTELYVEWGASLEDLRRLLNHKSSSVTATYIHQTDERLQNIAVDVGRSQREPPKPTRPDQKLRLIR